MQSVVDRNVVMRRIPVLCVASVLSWTLFTVMSCFEHFGNWVFFSGVRYKRSDTVWSFRKPSITDDKVPIFLTFY